MDSDYTIWEEHPHDPHPRSPVKEERLREQLRVLLEHERTRPLRERTVYEDGKERPL